MRIVGGRHRGRALTAPANSSIRPTSDRVREALFNILTQGAIGAEAPADRVFDAVVLDAFVGSGALALEALSRGAARVYGMDVARSSLDLARRNARTLGEAERLTLIKADATRPPKAREAADLVFLDPPYGKGFVVPALAALDRAGWIAPGALAVVETSADEPDNEQKGWLPLRIKKIGSTIVTFFFINKTEQDHF